MVESRRQWLRLAAGLGVVASTTQLVAQAEREVWRVGFVSNYAPFSQLQGTPLALKGFDVDVVRALAKAQQVQLQIVNGHARALFDALEQGRLDFIGNQILATADMRERFIFAEGYVDLRLILCQREDDERDFLSLEDFQGFKLGVLEGTAADEQGSAVLGPDIARFQATPEGLQALSGKQIDAFMDENLILDHLIFKQHLPLKTTTPFSPAIRTGWVVARQHRDLRERLSKGVALLKTQDHIKRISERWFGYDVSQKRAGAMIVDPRVKTPGQ